MWICNWWSWLFFISNSWSLYFVIEFNCRVRVCICYVNKFTFCWWDYYILVIDCFFYLSYFSLFNNYLLILLISFSSLFILSFNSYLIAAILWSFNKISLSNLYICSSLYFSWFSISSILVFINPLSSIYFTLLLPVYYIYNIN